MTRASFRVPILLAGLAHLTSACPAEPTPESVTIGIVAPLTGDLAAQGVDLVDAARLAVELINDVGGVVGKTLVLDVRDDGSTIEGATVAAQALADAGVVAVVGSVGTPLSRAVAQVTSARGVTLLVPAATGLDFRKASETLSAQWPVVRSCASEALIPQGIVDLAVEDQIVEVGIISDPGAYGSAMSAAIVAAATAPTATFTLEIVLESIRTTPDRDADLVEKMLAKEPKAIILVLGPEAGGSIVRTMVQNHPQNLVPLYLTESLANNAFIARAGTDALAQVTHRGVLIAYAGRFFGGFSAMYEGRYAAAPRPFQAQTFDALMMLALGMASQASAEGTALWQAVADASAGGETLDASRLLDAFAIAALGDDVNYDGASGAVDVDASGDVFAPLARWSVVDGEITVTTPP